MQRNVFESSPSNGCTHGCQFYLCTIIDAEEHKPEPCCAEYDEDSSNSSSSDEEEVYLACKCQPLRPSVSSSRSRQRCFRVRTPSRMRIVLSEDSC